MFNDAGYNRFNGKFYVPNEPELNKYLGTKCKLCNRVRSNLTPFEYSMLTVTELCQHGSCIDFGNIINNLVPHWLPDDEQESLDGLVAKNHLKTCEWNHLPNIFEPKNTYDTKINKFFISEGLNIFELIDYMPQLAFGTYLACFVLEKDGIIEPMLFDEYIKWDTDTKQRGFAMLELLGYVKLAFWYNVSYGYYAERFHYYVFRKSIYHDFPEVKDYYEYLDL